MELEGKTIVILTEQLYHDLEFWYPYYRIREAGGEMIVAGPAADTVYTGKLGTPVQSDAAAGGIAVADCAGLIIPGGYAPDYMRRDPAMVALVRDFHDAGKVVAAICHAGWMLASAGILKGRQVTSVSAIKDDLVNAGARWIDQEVVCDGNLITSRMPDDLPVFMRTIIRAL